MRFELTILGCNSALPTVRRFQTAQLLNVSEQFFLIDCGEGTQIQMRRFKKSIQKINHIFISHLHADHFIGLPGLLSSLALLGRTKPLHIYGQPPLKDYIDFHIKMFGGRIEYPIEFHSSNKSKALELIYKDNVVTVHSFPLEHGNMPTFGFLFKETPRLPNLIKSKIDFYDIPIRDLQYIRHGADFKTIEGDIVPNRELVMPPIGTRSYAFCSDTKYNEKIIPIIKEVDLLYHEATFSAAEEELASKRFHSTTKQAATIAKKAKVKQLLIGHYSARYTDLRMLELEAKTIFPNTIAVTDGTQVILPKESRRQI